MRVKNGEKNSRLSQNFAHPSPAQVRASEISASVVCIFRERGEEYDFSSVLPHYLVAVCVCVCLHFFATFQATALSAQKVLPVVPAGTLFRCYLSPLCVDFFSRRATRLFCRRALLRKWKKIHKAKPLQVTVSYFRAVFPLEPFS